MPKNLCFSPDFGEGRLIGACSSQFAKVRIFRQEIVHFRKVYSLNQSFSEIFVLVISCSGGF